MTDRYDAFTVVLERNIRTDDAEPVLAAIRQLRGVLDVIPEDRLCPVCLGAPDPTCEEHGR